MRYSSEHFAYREIPNLLQILILVLTNIPSHQLFDPQPPDHQMFQIQILWQIQGGWMATGEV